MEKRYLGSLCRSAGILTIVLPALSIAFLVALSCSATSHGRKNSNGISTRTPESNTSGCDYITKDTECASVKNSVREEDVERILVGSEVRLRIRSNPDTLIERTATCRLDIRSISNEPTTEEQRQALMLLSQFGAAEWELWAKASQLEPCDEIFRYESWTNLYLEVDSEPMEVLPVSKNLEIIEVSGRYAGEMIIQMEWEKYTSLREVTITSNIDDARVIAAALQAPILEWLNLSRTQYGDEVFEMLLDTRSSATVYLGKHLAYRAGEHYLEWCTVRRPGVTEMHLSSDSGTLRHLPLKSWIQLVSMRDLELLILEDFAIPQGVSFGSLIESGQLSSLELSDCVVKGQPFDMLGSSHVSINIYDTELGESIHQLAQVECQSLTILPIDSEREQVIDAMRHPKCSQVEILD